MKEYRIGESIYFRGASGDPDKTWGRVTDVLYSAPTGQIRSYGVTVDGGVETRVSLDQIIDLDEISTKAGEALARIARRDRAKADLLDYLLGALNYYADREGNIDYLVDGVWHNALVRDLVEEYKAKRDEAANTQ